MKKFNLKKFIFLPITFFIFSFGANNSEEILFYNKTKNEEKNYDVGEGIPQWEDHIFAPFVDDASYDIYGNGYWGAPNLIKYKENINNKYFNLGFINSVSSSIENSIIPWGFGSLSSLGQSSNNEQYSGIKKSIKDVRTSGGDVTISFGGAAGVPFWNVTQNEDVLFNTYKDIIEKFNLTYIDLDIEGSGENIDNNEVNARVIKRIQDELNVKVNITLPTLTTGLDYYGLEVLKKYVEADVDINYVNIMAMLGGGSNSEEVISAIEGLKSQLSKLYPSKSEEEIYSMIGFTNSIGIESIYNFTVEDAAKVTDYAIEKDLGMVSYWSLNRDALDNGSSNIGVYDAYEFGKEYRRFTDHNDGGTVVTPNVSITDFNLNELNSDNATFNYELSTSNNPKINSIKVVTNNGNQFVSEEITNGSESGKIKITNLKNGVNYNVSLLVKYDDNKQIKSSPLEFKIENSNSITIDKFELFEMNSDNVTFNYELSKNGVIDIKEIKVIDKNNHNIVSETITNFSTSGKIKVFNLSKDENYNFSLSVSYGNNINIFSDTISVDLNDYKEKSTSKILIIILLVFLSLSILSNIVLTLVLVFKK